jgi:hypothetical protein
MKTRGGKIRWLVLIAAAVPILLLAQGGEVVTPAGAYTDPGWRQKAASFGGNLTRIQSEIGAKFQPGAFQLLNTGESSAGGIGLWPNPVNFGQPARYLGVFARVQLPPPSTGRSFPDTESGRILTVMDTYGKETIGMMARELASMSDPQLAGGALIFIYCKRPPTDPAFEQEAEALALFVPRQTLTAFAELRMTIQTLFSQSETLPIFSGADQITNLRMYILQP